MNKQERDAAREKAVMDWIQEAFDMDEIEIEDFPIFPNGKLIKDKQGGQLCAYFDFLTGEVKHAFPDDKKLKR